MKLIAKTNNKKILGILVAGAVSAAPFLNPIAAQADPPSHAPAWGYRDDDRGRGRDKKNEKKNDKDWRKDRDRDSRDRDYRDRDDRDRDDRYNRDITLRGLVTRDLSGDSFTLRADNGRTYRVVAQNEPRNLSNGDRVEVYGSIQNGTFYAARVSLLNDRDGGWNGGYPGNNQRIDFQGTALRVYSQYRLDVRGDNGRTYQVTSEDNFSNRINNGDRVRVAGVFTGGNDIRAEKVQLVDDRNGSWNGSNPGYGSLVDFPGRVESSSYNNGVATLRVRGDNGRNYTVYIRSNTRYRNGERVRVVGTFTNGVVYASTVTR
jgi:outer membrane lipoprotein SlyB